MMQYGVFAVPAVGGAEATEELNRFLRGKRVLTVERRLIEVGSASVWTFCVEFLETPTADGGRFTQKVDYREILPPDQFAKFSRLRALRKDVAEKESVPPYAVFTNEQLAAMARIESPSLQALQAIPGVGEAKTTKYGAAFLKALTEAPAESIRHEKSG